MEEQELIAGCLDGKEKYQKALYETYYSRMMQVCCRYARDREEARDILHEGYLKVFKHLNQYKHEGSFEGWMKKIMVNTAINYFNRINSKNALIYYEEGALVAEIETSFFTEEENAFSEYSMDDLLLMIQELSPAYRTVFNLYAIEGYSHKEISALLNISEGTSKSNLSKARQKLQEELTKKTKSYVG